MSSNRMSRSTDMLRSEERRREEASGKESKNKTEREGERKNERSCVNPHDLSSTFGVGKRELDSSIQSSRSKKSGIQSIGPGET